MAQALLTAWLLRRVTESVLPGLAAPGFVLLVAVLAAFSWLPWLVSEVMPDLFTALLVLALTLLACAPAGSAMAGDTPAGKTAAGPLAGRPDRQTNGLTSIMASRQTAHPSGDPSAKTGVATGCASKRGGAVAEAALIGVTALMIATQQSSILLSLGLIAVLSVYGWRSSAAHVPASAVAALSFPGSLPRRGLARLDQAAPLALFLGSLFSGSLCSGRLVWGRLGRARFALARLSLAGLSLARLALPPLLAIGALCAVNAAAHGRFAVSPFGNIFLLADGPALDALHRDCPQAGWRLCAYRDAIPANSDDFLWTDDSPLNRAGGPKQVATEADAIIRAAVHGDPAGTVLAAVRNTIAQAVHFASGDGLQAWPHEVTAHIMRDFPAAEAAHYATARQQQGRLAVPWPLGEIHEVTGLAGVIACALLLRGAWRRRDRVAGLMIAVLMALVLNAMITGALSGPHDRYQARVMWLPFFAAALGVASLWRGHRAAACARRSGTSAAAPAAHGDYRAADRAPLDGQRDEQAQVDETPDNRRSRQTEPKL